MAEERQTEPFISYYEVLEVSPEATDEEIKRAFREKAMRYHPDHNPANRLQSVQRFMQIKEAYEHLSSKEKRRKHNRKLELLAQNDNTAYSSSLVSQLAGIIWPSKAPKKQG